MRRDGGAGGAARQRRALLGGLSPRVFLAEVWQRRPHLARGALPGLRNPLTPEELAGLACDTDLPARIVHTLRAGRPWQVEHGPFDAAHFQHLPERDWTLLVQGVDRLVPAVAALRARFDFLPAWRLDDVMVSYAAPGGSVGPHIDSYDVFLVQLHGHRRWQIDTRTAPATLALSQALAGRRDGEGVTGGLTHAPLDDAALAGRRDEEEATGGLTHAPLDDAALAGRRDGEGATGAGHPRAPESEGPRAHRSRRRQAAQAVEPKTLELRTDTPLRILKHFEPTAEWLLGPGDLLYLPPGVAHYGVAQGPCMTYSIGFRAPSGREVWSGYLEHLLTTIDDGGRYTDPDLLPVRHPGALEEATIDRVMALLERLPRHREALAEWFGRHVTEPGPGAPMPGPVPRLERLLAALATGDSHLRRGLGQRIAWRRVGGSTQVYAAGEAWTLTGLLAAWARRVGDLPEGTELPAPPRLDNPRTQALLRAWLGLGVVTERRNRRPRGR